MIQPVLTPQRQSLRKVLIWPHRAGRLIGARGVSQDRGREAVHTALLRTARPQMVRARLQHVLADTGTLVRDGACSITPVAGEAPIWWALP